MSTPKPADSGVDVHEIDIRPIIAARGAPIGAILAAVDALPAGAALRLIAPFEPEPLYAKLDRMGFDHTARTREDGAWEILFSPRQPVEPEPVLLDLRAFVPPEPMRILNASLAVLPSGGVLIALTQSPLDPSAQTPGERGLAWESHEQSDGSWETFVTRASPPRETPGSMPGPSGNQQGSCEKVCRALTCIKAPTPPPG